MKFLLGVFIALIVIILQQHGYLEKAVDKSTEAIEQVTPGQYSVIKVEDGDTITVDMEGKPERIRLIGVDTPEKNDPRKPVQCFAQAASDYTTGLIGDNRVLLVADSETTNRDRYNRLLRYVYLADGTFVNKKLIEDGYGFMLSGFPFTKQPEFKTAEEQARQAGRGLWTGCQIDTSTGYNQTNPVPRPL